MLPTLYGAPLSPFVRKVRSLLVIKEIEYTPKMIVPYATPDGYETLSPLKRVPALTLGDICLADSAVICHFLDDYYPQTPMIPKDFVARSHCEWLEKFADYELAPWTTFTVFRQRVLYKLEGKDIDQATIDSAINDKLPPLFNYLESQLSGLYFIGDSLSLADLAIASQLISFEHGGEQIEPARWPKLSAFYKNMCEQPFLTEIIQSEKVALKKLFSR